MQNSFRTRSELMQNRFRIHPELIQSSFRTHSELVHIFSRPHTESIQKSFRAHSEPMQNSFIIDSELKTHLEFIQISARTHAESIQNPGRTISESIQNSSRVHSDLIQKGSWWRPQTRNMGREASGGENHRFGYVQVWFSLGFVGAARNKKYGPESVGMQKPSICICLAMVFRGVRESGRKQGIWAGRRREVKIIDLDMFRYGFP